MRKALWIAVGVVALGGAGYGLWWALADPSSSTGAGRGAGAPGPVAGGAVAGGNAGALPQSKAAGASLPLSPTGGESASTYVRTIGDAFGAVVGAIGGARS